MADYNKVILLGRLTRDPTLKYTPSQMAICEFSIAVGRKFKTASGEQREETAFVECTVWGKGGEIFNQYMTKGKQVMIDGRLKFDSWEDKNGGGKRSKLTVTVEDFQFVGNRGDGDRAPQGGDEEGGGAPPPRPMGRPPQQSRPPAAAPQAQPQAPYGEEQQFNEDDIPF
ncbi:MAG TPA: single-stranded DNA-binding protein [Tepidisphaeraceae bacterium]|jgi:single-strand DNA-binding protein